MCSTQQALVVLFIGTFASAVLALPGVPLHGDFYAYPKYSYSYGVDDKLTGDHKSAHETRDGGIVKGSYSFLQPDGIFRTVEYVADPIHGFQAKVINSPGPAIHAVAKKVVAPVPVIAHGGYGYGGGVAAVKPVVGLGYGGYGTGIAAVQPGVGLGYGGYGGLGGLGGYGGHGLGAVAAVKPAAVAYTQAYGPGIARGGLGLGHAGAGIGGAGYLGGFVGGAGYGGYY